MTFNLYDVVAVINSEITETTRSTNYRRLQISQNFTKLFPRVGDVLLGYSASTIRREIWMHEARNEGWFSTLDEGGSRIVVPINYSNETGVLIHRGSVVACTIRLDTFALIARTFRTLMFSSSVSGKMTRFTSYSLLKRKVSTVFAFFRNDKIYELLFAEKEKWVLYLLFFFAILDCFLRSWETTLFFQWLASNLLHFDFLGRCVIINL